MEELAVKNDSGRVIEVVGEVDTLESILCSVARLFVVIRIGESVLVSSTFNLSALTTLR